MPHGLAGPAPAVTLQANFVRGGLILALAAHHAIIYGTADFQFFKMSFAFLIGHQLETVDLEQANHDSSHLILLIPEVNLLFDMLTSQPIWCYFLIPVETLNNLVERARDKHSGINVQISDDRMSALYWKILFPLRIARGMPPDTESKCSHAINTRVALGIPSSYIGA
ncbi:hypothetical protein N7493_007347 [Penicillium malachiteum]|uniref:Uncharacterized protein n=1 Tax=Penicillium malachiteum TaxID=1324776 RepID=A0AAD6MUX9_9EURO|nr:hypothetical protein N7493_007347 [Penicillium malachiteum]